MRMISLMIAMGVLFLLSPQSAQADKLTNGVLGRCGEPCFVDDNPGGEVSDFLDAAKAIQHGARNQVIIPWRCASACAIFADKARPHVCIMPSTVFAFHKGTHSLMRGDEVVKVLGTFDPPQSSDIHAWVKAHGGFPKAEYFRDMLKMKYEEASKFFPRCTAAQLHPKKA